MRYEILRLGPVVVVLLFIAGVFLWFWLDERRFAAQVDRRFAPYKTHPKPLQFAETGDFLDHLATVEQRVTALEKYNRWHRTAAELLMNLEPRLAEVENVMNQIHKLEPPLPLAATPSQVTDASITGANWDVAKQESIPAPFQQSWQSAQPTTNAGRVERFYDSVDPEDVLT